MSNTIINPEPIEWAAKDGTVYRFNWRRLGLVEGGRCRAQLMLASEHPERIFGAAWEAFKVAVLGVEGIDMEPGPGGWTEATATELMRRIGGNDQTVARVGVAILHDDTLGEARAGN